jgi:hypothetical protein
MRVVDLAWLSVPAVPEADRAALGMGLAAMLGLGGLWLAFFLRELGRMPLLPVNDPSLPDVLHGAEALPAPTPGTGEFGAGAPGVRR